ncbi:hypothetical protein BCD48_43495 [Pseudofrankia sp. BMG5.36]|nr:hypothetical protein BCD48_43495 [Pseudofrankia sp. BMG5.36]
MPGEGRTLQGPRSVPTEATALTSTDGIFGMHNVEDLVADLPAQAWCRSSAGADTSYRCPGQRDRELAEGGAAIGHARLHCYRKIYAIDAMLILV